MRFENLVLRPGGTQPRQESSRVGRSDEAEIGRIGPEARTLAEAQDRDVRQPRPALGTIDAERLETSVQVVGERRSTPFLVVEHDHADAARLAVAQRREADLAGARGGLPEGGDDLRKPSGVDVPEEGERDVEVL